MAALDVLAAGGTLNIEITSADATTGDIFIPASVTGAGKCATFVRDLAWTLSASGLSVSNQVVAGAMYTITLSRH